jgi:DmsE family decaheme c-type cytochrome
MPVREGKLECLSCHNPHGSAGPSLLAEYSVNENCYRCHAERRGPFLWEHPPVREGCTNCHDPHGSIYDRLLLRDTPRLCQECHNIAEHPAEPFGSGARYVYNRSCLNCHATIHGSNHPSGHVFQR